MKKLSQLIKHIYEGDIPETEITSVHYDSRKVTPGGLFVAVKGFASDGHDYAEQAAKNGAAAIIVQNDVSVSGDTGIYKVENSRKALGEIAARFYSRDGKTPSERIKLIGITGTNGKTTITYLLENIIRKAGFNPGVIGTVNTRYCGTEHPNPMTTPESSDLQRIIFDMAEAGVTHVIMEVSSHAIDLDRTDSCMFDVGIFTNLSQDHLDYHNTLEEYGSCKMRLFTDYLPRSPKGDLAVAVINQDDPWGETISQSVTCKLLSTGIKGKRSISAENVEFSLSGTSCLIKTPDSSFDLNCSLVGRFNLENILNAIGASKALEIADKDIIAGVQSFSNVPGRLDSVKNGQGLFVFVDYAHTPDALDNVLSTLKKVASGRLITVFGCGGDRDRTKRPLMAGIAEKHSDISIATSDNPRTEDPAAILEDVKKGFSKNLACISPEELKEATLKTPVYIVEQDRGAAIRLAVSLAKPGDSILIAGKGHEDYQIIGTEKIFFDDRIEAASALKERA